jgi:hypothetical protein
MKASSYTTGLGITLALFVWATALTQPTQAMANGQASGEVPQTQEVDLEQPFPAPEQPLVVRMYNVGDLIHQNDDHPFSGFVLPGVSDQNSIPLPRSTTGNPTMGWPGAGGMGGGGGGGMFRMLPAAPGKIQMGGGMGGLSSGITARPQNGSMNALISIIMETVAIDYWLEAGGEGTISNFGDILIVSQTDSVHQQIDAFLALLRATRKVNKTPITIKAIWLTLDEEQLGTLKVTKNQTVDQEALNALVKEHGLRGQITCFDGQTVHIAAGNLKSSIESVVPVVGQNEIENPLRVVVASQPSQDSDSSQPLLPKHVMAQVGAGGGTSSGIQGGGFGGQAGSGFGSRSSSVGYNPVMRWINYGAICQVTPRIESENQRIHLDLASIYTLPNSDVRRSAVIAGSADVDRHDLRSQQFLTSVRLKDATPTLIGGSAISEVSSRFKQTYLIVEAILGDQ